MNRKYLAVEEVDLTANPFFKNPAFLKIEDDTYQQPIIEMGYPRGSEITYYINLAKIVAISPEDDYLRVFFSVACSLNIYRKDQGERLLRALNTLE